MQLADFIDACNMRSKNEDEVFELLCYYSAKENGMVSFSVKNMGHVYSDAGIAVPDHVRLKNEALRSKRFRPFGIEGTLRFSKDLFRELDKMYGHFWSETGKKSAETAGGIVRGGIVRLTDFAELCGMSSSSETKNFELLCYYMMKEKGEKAFSAGGMLDIFEDAGLVRPSKSMLDKLSKKHPSFKITGVDGTVVFDPDAVISLDAKYGHLWKAAPSVSAEIVPEGISVIDEKIFSGKREGFDKLITQINSTYRNGSFDSCAMVMRRLLEASLILSFQTNSAEDAISQDGKYLCFGDIVKKTIDNEMFGLSAADLTDASHIGDYSDRGPTYTFGANDINLPRNAYRNVLTALFKASKLL